MENASPILLLLLAGGGLALLLGRKSGTVTPPSSSRVRWQAKDWYLQGANLPWLNFGADFSGGSGGVAANISTIQTRLTAAPGAHVIRWWVFPGPGTQLDNISQTYPDFDAALNLAASLNIYYDFVLFSSPSAIGTRINSPGTVIQQLTPLLTRYGNNPRILSWEIFNEPEYDMWSNTVPTATVQTFVSQVLDAIHANTMQLVNMGPATFSGFPFWTAMPFDFWSPHWYEQFGPDDDALATNYAALAAKFGLTKPVVIGEYQQDQANPLARMDEFYSRGYAGAWGWSLFDDRTGDHFAIDRQALVAFSAEHADAGPVGTTSPSTPAAPSGLVAIAVSSSRIDVTWVDNSNNEVAFLLEISQDGSNWNPFPSIGTGVQNFQNTGLQANTQYFYRVKALGTTTNSPYSNVGTATTLTVVQPPLVPAAPTNLVAMTVGQAVAHLTWMDNATNETGYQIQFSFDNGGTWLNFPASPPNISLYDVGNLDTLAPNTTVWYRVYAFNAQGNSNFSNVSSAVANPQQVNVTVVTLAPTNGVSFHAGDTATLGGTVTTNGQAGQGFVDILLDGAVLTTVLIAAGVFSVTINNLAQGNHNLQARHVSTGVLSAIVAISVQGQVVNNPGILFLTSPSGTQAAFADTFDAPHAVFNRSGELDGNIWGVSRMSGSGTNLGQGEYNMWLPSRMDTPSGPIQVMAPNDVKVINGQVFEAVRDDLTVTVLAMYPKQPFDFAGRTGTVVFDVSNDTLGIHDVWPEFWITDQPIPAPFVHFSSWVAWPRNSLGISFAASGGLCGNGFTVDRLMISGRLGPYVGEDTEQGANIPFTTPECAGLSDGTTMNHVEVRISQNTLDVYASDAGTLNMRHICHADNLNLSFTRGLIWIEDAHYNPEKSSMPFLHTEHTFRWDNVAFDGPFTYKDVSHDVLDSMSTALNGQKNLGWRADPTTPMNVNTLPILQSNLSVAQAARLMFNYVSPNAPVTTFNYSINGHNHTAPVPAPQNVVNSPYSLAIDLSLNELVAGPNNIILSANQVVVFTNVNIVLVDVGGGAPPPPTTPSAPTNLVLGQITQTQLGLTWQDNSNNETGFQVEISLDGVAWVPFPTLAANLQTFLNTGLAPSTLYRYRVAAFNAAGLSGYSNIAQATTLAVTAPPTGLWQDVTPGGLAARAIAADPAHPGTVYAGLQTNQASNLGGQGIWKSTDYGATWARVDNGFFDSGGVPMTINVGPNGDVYLFNVYTGNPGVFRSTNGGSNWTQLLSGDFNNVSIDPNNPNHLLTAFHSRHDICGGECDTGVMESNDNGASWHASSVIPTGGWGQYVHFVTSSIWIVATQNHGTFRTADSGATWTKILPASALAWADLKRIGSVLYIGLEDGIYRSVDTGITWTNVLPESSPDVYMGIAVDSTGRLYAHSAYPFTGYGGGSFKTSADGITWTNMNAQSFAQGADQMSADANFLYAAMWQLGVWRFQLGAVTPPTNPSDPSGLAASGVSSSSITLSWSDNSNNETGFDLEVSLNSGGTWVQLPAISAGVTQFQHTGLNPSTTYTYRIRALGSAGNSGYSNTVSATTTGSAPTIPVAPSNLVAGNITQTQIVLGWQDNSNNETGFSLEVSANGGASWAPFPDIAPGVTTFTNSALTPATNYQYRVRAFNAAGNSAYSNVLPVQTLAGQPPPPTGQWNNVTGNLANMASQCGTAYHIIAVPNSSRVIVGIMNNGLYYNDTLGSPWVKMGQNGASQPFNAGLTQIVFDPNNSNTWWASGIYGSNGGVYHTTDGGITLNYLPQVFHVDSIGVDFTDPNRQTMLAGGHESHSLYKSVNGGGSWVDIGASVPGGGFTSDVLVINALTYLVNTGAGIARTTDGGVTWTQVYGQKPTSSATPLRTSTGVIYWLLESFQMVRSIDNGATWTNLGGLFLNGTSPIELPDGRIVAGDANSRTLLASSDQGSTWQPLGPAMPLNTIYYRQSSIAYSSARQAFFFAQWDCVGNVQPDAIQEMILTGGSGFATPTATPFAIRTATPTMTQTPTQVFTVTPSPTRTSTPTVTATPVLLQCQELIQQFTSGIWKTIATLMYRAANCLPSGAG